ncbi:MAG: L-ribulose-5-phosphate 4-epimerase AraD [Chloroflexi bacterium]|nr:L-ribulose-5-phosphate 4-epimerase AraD [Chloroflexota bacterium]
MHAALREQVFLANRAIVAAGLVRLTFGNVSGADREAGVMAIKPSGVPYGELGPEAMVVLDLGTGQMVDGRYRPSSDTPTHLELYRAFPSIGGIVHIHSLYATSWAQAKTPIPCLGTTHADHFHGAVPVTRPLSQGEIEGPYERSTGTVIIETIRDLGLEPLEVPAVLVASHGPFAWGSDPAHAVDNAVALETVAELALHAMQIDAALIPIQEELLERHDRREHGTAAYYGQR